MKIIDRHHHVISIPIIIILISIGIANMSWDSNDDLMESTSGRSLANLWVFLLQWVFFNTTTMWILKLTKIIDIIEILQFFIQVSHINNYCTIIFQQHNMCQIECNLKMLHEFKRKEFTHVTFHKKTFIATITAGMYSTTWSSLRTVRRFDSSAKMLQPSDTSNSAKVKYPLFLRKLKAFGENLYNSRVCEIFMKTQDV